jgi:predicted amidophosphoribosyltransferase
LQSGGFELSEVEEEQEMEIVVEMPVVDGGSYLYVCAECGNDLTEIPYYNRYYCENCGLHY